jgi:hypothetical protein
VDELNIDLTKMDDAANEIGSRVASSVLEAFAAAPAAAQAAAGANVSYMTSAAMIAMFADIAMAIKQLNTHTSEHAELLRNTAQLMRDRDTRMATDTFSATTIFTTGG